VHATATWCGVVWCGVCGTEKSQQNSVFYSHSVNFSPNLPLKFHDSIAEAQKQKQILSVFIVGNRGGSTAAIALFRCQKKRGAVFLFSFLKHAKMGRMHTPGKGISRSSLPYRRSPPAWCKIEPEVVKEEIVKYAKKGLTPSQIGVVLRDSMGIPQVFSITGNKILRILKAAGLGAELPEDLYHLIKKAVNIRKHLEKNRKDKDSKFRLILVESRIHRLSRYYKTTKALPPNWKYESSTANALVA